MQKGVFQKPHPIPARKVEKCDLSPRAQGAFGKEGGWVCWVDGQSGTGLVAVTVGRAVKEQGWQGLASLPPGLVALQSWRPFHGRKGQEKTG